MKVEILYVEGCPNHRPASERVKVGLDASPYTKGTALGAGRQGAQANQCGNAYASML
jgi:hypothetical protein